MNKCNKCNTEMKLLFSSFYCPNDCDRISSAPQNKSIRQARCINVGALGLIACVPECLELNKIYNIKDHPKYPNLYKVDCCSEHLFNGGWEKERFVEIHE